MAEEANRVSHPEGRVCGIGCIYVHVCARVQCMHRHVCMCVHVYISNMHVCVCAPVCMCAQGQELCLRTNQDSVVRPAGGVLTPRPLGGGVFSDTLVLGTCRAH